MALHLAGEAGRSVILGLCFHGCTDEHPRHMQ